MNKCVYRYSVVGTNDSRDQAFHYQTYSKYSFDDDLELEWLVNDCAADFFNNHDGWEIVSWVRNDVPLEFIVWLDNSKERRYNVWVHGKPSFYARELT